MSTTRYKVKFKDNLGSYGETRERYLYVNDHHTSGVTTVYNDEGEVVYSWTEDSDEEAALLARIIRDECGEEEREFWNWDEGGPKTETADEQISSADYRGFRVEVWRNANAKTFYSLAFNTAAKTPSSVASDDFDNAEDALRAAKTKVDKRLARALADPKGTEGEEK